MKTIMTTAGRPDEITIKLAVEAAEVLGYPFVERKKRSVARLHKEYQCAVIVSGHDRFELYHPGMEKPFFFHPNSAAFRLKRLVKGDQDPLIEVAKLKEGDSFLDCTLGLAADSIIASYAVGESGKVLGIEKESDVAFIVQEGLKKFETAFPELREAMNRVQVQQADAVAYLKDASYNQWDIVYIDPMFSAPIDESANFTPLREVGSNSQLTKEWVEEAYRVCKRSVIVKDHFNSPVFDAFHFKQVIRPNTKFHYGYLAKE